MCSQWACILVSNPCYHILTAVITSASFTVFTPSLCCSEIASVLSLKVVLQEKPAGLQQQAAKTQIQHPHL